MDSLRQLQDLLRELFQLDMADLDFGLYRLLHLRRDEIEAFLTQQLPRRVEETFKSAAGEERAALEKEVLNLTERIRKEIAEDALLEDGEINQEYKDIKAKAMRELLGSYRAKREQLQSIQASEAQKAEVFNHLYNFFSRYYEAGDFIPRRRYGAREIYAAPYNGEETFFHWANKDQHYVKSGETFKDYAFTVEGLGGPFRVRFLLSEASLPPGNTKGDTRYFFPLPDQISWEIESKNLNIPFHYRLPSEGEIEKYGKNSRFQEGILRNSLSKILDAVPDRSLRAALVATVEEKEDQDISRLFKRMRHFCKRNTSDYFIHRNLQGFLEQELEFYIKDQVLHLADIEGDLEAKRRTIRVIRQLAEEIITFLAQIENVQKRLFEKKKFVLRTEYLVPIKEVPRELWKEILENKAQIGAWKTLFAIDPQKDLFNQKGKINEKFVRDNPTLVVDTSHFDGEFKERFLAHFDNLDEVTDGLIIHSENYQALRFLERKYAGKVECIYIDPPYNTGNDGFIYKDRYKHSSWLAMIENRINLLRRCTSEGGVVFISIDENEHDTLLNLVKQLNGSELIADYIWKGRSGQTGTIKMVSYQHEYIVCFSFDSENTRLALQKRMHEGGKFEDTKGTYTREQLRQWGQADRREDRPQMWYGIPNPQNNEELVFPIKEDGTEGRWRVGKQKAFQLLAGNDLDFVSESGRWQVYKKVRAGTVTYSAFGTVLDRTGTTAEGTKVIQDLFGDRVYQYPKPPKLIEFIISIGTEEKKCPFIFDFFAGSGTTGHAVININREDGGCRKFILVEMADFLDTVLLPRIQKVMFTPEWKDGKPKRLPTEEEVERTPRLIKMVRLEGYEDALHNLTTEETLKREEPRSTAYKEKLGEDAYRLHYLVRLPLESSNSMLNLSALEHPFNYKLEVLAEKGPKFENVDLVETFSYLCGLHVQRVETWINNKEKRKYRAVRGKNGEGRRVLVLWRDMDNLDPRVEREFLESRLKSEGPFDEILINGDSATPGIKSLDPLFKRLMEEGE